jgi:pimeloyl-ACP methyl ester carboxylesterase
MRHFQITSLKLIVLLCLTPCAGHSSAQEANEPTEQVSSWFGTLDLKAIKLRLQLDVTTEEDGQRSAFIISLDQGNAKIKMDQVAMKDGKLTFASKALNCSYEGTAKGENEFEGTFKQHGQEMPLTFKRVDDPESMLPKRPQHPKEPFPYESQDVTFNSDSDNDSDNTVTLAGTLTMPKGDGPFPAVVLVTGSGPQDRDESLMGHKPFLVIADYLTRHGIAVLRYDDRGFGASTGNFVTATTEDFASDAAAGIAFLAGHEKIDAARIGLVGHSEGGLIGAMLAAADERLAHVVLLSGPGIPGDEVIRTQSAALTEAAGQPRNSDDVKLIDEVMEAAKSGASAEEIIAIAEKYDRDNENSDENSDADSGEPTETDENEVDDEPPTDETDLKNLTRQKMAQFATPWFRFFLAYDPRPDLAKARCPVLAMNGSKDLQVLVDLNLPAIEKALQSAPVQGHRFERLEGLNHLFQNASTGLPNEYGDIEETFDPQALQMISDWVLAH